MMRFRFNAEQLAKALQDGAVAALQARGDQVGALVRRQTLRRFDEHGDDEIRWPELMANNDDAMRQMIERRTPDMTEARTMHRVQVVETKRARDRVRDRISAGQVTGQKAVQQLRRARNRYRIALEQQQTGNPSYRRGGEPLRDTGAGRAGLFWRVVRVRDGVQVEVGTAQSYMEYQQTGFTTKGPNYIPLTIQAKKKPKGADPAEYDLIPGYDYVIARRGVKVPPRPFVRMSRRDSVEMAALFGSEA